MWKLPRRTIWLAGCTALAIPLVSCPERPAPRAHPTDVDRRLVEPSAPPPRPVATATPVPVPASAPASRPASAASGTDEDFRLVVTAGDESHTGFWLTILAKTDPSAPAEARGRVAKERKLYVDTTNVQALRVDLTVAPIRRDRNPGFFLDGQPGMEVRRSTRALEFRRSRGRVWVLTKSERAKKPAKERHPK